MKSLSRALTLLTELSRNDEPLTLSDLSDLVGLHKSTVHRMLATFMSYGLVIRDEANRYVVGPRALDLAEAASSHIGGDSAVQLALMGLGGEVGEAAWYAVPDGRGLRYAAVASGGVVAEPGGHRPTVSLHSTAVGKAYLAYRPHEEVLAYMARQPFAAKTPFTITDSQTLQRVLGSVRRRGYATEDRESHPRARRIGVAVLNPRGHAVGAVAVGVPATVENEQLAHIPDAVLSCAADIESDLFGARYPRELPHAVRAGATRGGVACLPT